MKKQTLVIILLAILVVSCLALTACHSCEFGEWTVKTAATCTQAGQEQRVCECGEVEVRDVPATGHTFGEWTVINQADCNEAGLKVQVCECGASKTEIISATGHSYQAVVTDPTCLEQGYTTHICHCGDSYVDTYVDATGHSSGSNICANCGDKLYSIGLAHTLSEDGNSYILFGIGTCTDMDVLIPSTYEGKPVTSIGEKAFYCCDSLTSITIPDSVMSIGAAAFYGCSSLTSITIPSGVESIGLGAFGNWTSLTNIVVDANNPNYQSIDGNLYSKDGKTLIQYAIGKTATSFAIPSGVTSIGNYAFDGCTSLTSITIPNSVTSIGNYAFV